MNKTLVALLFVLVLIFTVSSGAQEETVKNSVGIEFVRIPAGSFLMGSQATDAGHTDDEIPQHEMVIETPFYISRFEITQKQWLAVMEPEADIEDDEANPSAFKGEDLPVETISWEDAQAFIAKLNDLEDTDVYRLPTEAEWEYACRAGTQTNFFFGDDPTMLKDYAWFDSNSEERTHPVGVKKPNPWNLHDMLGNVYEWCQDWYDEEYYRKDPKNPPEEPYSRPERVARGGYFFSRPRFCRCANRYHFPLDYAYHTIGLRLVKTIKE